MMNYFLFFSSIGSQKQCVNVKLLNMANILLFFSIEQRVMMNYLFFISRMPYGLTRVSNNTHLMWTAVLEIMSQCQYCLLFLCQPIRGHSFRYPNGKHLCTISNKTISFVWWCKHVIASFWNQTKCLYYFFFFSESSRLEWQQNIYCLYILYIANVLSCKENTHVPRVIAHKVHIIGWNVRRARVVSPHCSLLRLSRNFGNDCERQGVNLYTFRVSRIIERSHFRNVIGDVCLICN